MASIIILAIAIIPMVGMFDMGLQIGHQGSNYDKARALANLKLEEAKSLPSPPSRDKFPVTGARPLQRHGLLSIQACISVTGPASADFTDFQYRVEKQYEHAAAAHRLRMHFS